jgi:3-oxoacyl-[acyl-carrier protein] reductase
MAKQTTIKLSIEFQITQSMIESFAKLSGDYNSMHMNIEVARKSRFRQTIVHGMLPLSFLSIIQKKFPQQQIVFKELSAHFNKPVYADDAISLNISIQPKADNLYSFQSHWRRKENDELLLLAKGKMIVDDIKTNIAEKADDGSRNSFLLTPTTENQYLINELNDQKEVLDFSVTTELAEQYAKNVLNAANESDNILQLCPNLLATLLLSTMVGMRLPGRYATFTRFNINFSQNLTLRQKYKLHASLEKVSVAAEHIDASCDIRFQDEVYATGKYEVVLNSPPKVMLSSAQIKRTFMDFGLAGKVAMVTGASRGIGETTAKLFAMYGVKTVVCYFRGHSDAQAIVKDINQEGGEAFAVQCDLTDDAQVASMMQQVINRYGNIDILVNNAVREFTPKDVLDLDWKDYLKEMEVSVKGMHACCKAVIPMFKKAGQGKIINLSTIAVANPVSGQSRYITAKSAVEGYSKSLAVELTRFNIQVNLVIPNMTDTDLVSVIPALFRDRIANERASQRHVQPVEVAQSIIYLASSWSSAMTGQKIVLNLGEPPFA